MTSSKQSEKAVLKRFLAEIGSLWPLAKGSLAEVRKPCIRPHCSACASGKKHRAFIFSVKKDGCRQCMHVPLDMEPVMRQAIRNGRLIEEKISRMGAELLLQFRQQRLSSASKRKSE